MQKLIKESDAKRFNLIFLKYLVKNDDKEKPRGVYIERGGAI